MDKFFITIIEEYKNRYQTCDMAIAGHNGPYMQSETIVRNTAHWIISFSIMYELTKDEIYKGILSRFSNTLLNEVNKSTNGALVCIKREDNQTNGLIGLAWIMEGLVEAYRVLRNAKLLEAATKIYFSQRFDKKLHTWRIVDPNGKVGEVDIAFNHSLWFCMAAAKLVQYNFNALITRDISDYLTHIGKQFVLYGDGLISHFSVNSGNCMRNFKMRLRKTICAITGKGLPWKKWNSVEYERAYHLFSLYAFAWLYHFYPQSSFFQSRKFNKLKAYGINEDNFIAFPEMNSYAYGYNSPAYELPLIHYFFETGKDSECAEHTLTLHKKYNIAPDESSYTENVQDAITLDARVYEIMQYYRLKEETHEQ